MQVPDNNNIDGVPSIKEPPLDVILQTPSTVMATIDVAFCCLLSLEKHVLKCLTWCEGKVRRLPLIKRAWRRFIVRKKHSPWAVLVPDTVLYLTDMLVTITVLAWCIRGCSNGRALKAQPGGYGRLLFHRRIMFEDGEIKSILAFIRNTGWQIFNSRRKCQGSKL